MYYYMDPTMILLLIGFVITLLASTGMKRTFSVYSKIESDSGLTGEQTVRRILAQAGIHDVQVRPVNGSLTDHYDPRTKIVNLSADTYSRTSIAAVCVAAHECGHAIQHQVNYAPLNFRSALVPAANFGSSLAWPVFFIGLVASIRQLTTAGIILFSLAVLFQLVTLPVEFNASSRALTMLEGTGILSAEENAGARKVLRAAALTYVAALASSVLQLLRLVMIANNRSRRR